MYTQCSGCHRFVANEGDLCVEATADHDGEAVLVNDAVVVRLETTTAFTNVDRNGFCSACTSSVRTRGQILGASYDDADINLNSHEDVPALEDIYVEASVEISVLTNGYGIA